MRKIIILISVFNDWKSLIKLISEINENIKDFKNITFKYFIVNDASTISQPELRKPKNINQIKEIYCYIWPRFCRFNIGCCSK